MQCAAKLKNKKRCKSKTAHGWAYCRRHLDQGCICCKGRMPKKPKWTVCNRCANHIQTVEVNEDK